MIHGYHNGRGNRHVDLAWLCDFETDSTPNTHVAGNEEKSSNPATNSVSNSAGHWLAETETDSLVSPATPRPLSRHAAEDPHARDWSMSLAFDMRLKTPKALDLEEIEQVLCSIIEYKTVSLNTTNLLLPLPVIVSVRGGERKINMDLRINIAYLY